MRNTQELHCAHDQSAVGQKYNSTIPADVVASDIAIGPLFESASYAHPSMELANCPRYDSTRLLSIHSE
jgi:hypothetical protein